MTVMLAMPPDKRPQRLAKASASLGINARFRMKPESRPGGRSYGVVSSKDI